MSVGYTREQVQKLGLRDTEFCNETQLFYVKGTKPVKAIEPVKIDDGFVAVEAVVEVKDNTAIQENPLKKYALKSSDLEKIPKITVENTVGESNGII